MAAITKEEFKVLIKAMKAVYAQPTFIPDDDAAKVWYNLLMDIPYNVLQSAIQKHIMISPYPPTIADIRTAASSFRAKAYDEQLTEMEAWSMVSRAIGRSGYYSEEEFAKLPHLVQKAVGNAGNLKEWALTPTDAVNSVIQSHFVRNYRAAVQRAKDDAKLSPVLLQRIEEYQRLGSEKANDGLLTDTEKKAPEQNSSNPEYVAELLKKFR